MRFSDKQAASRLKKSLALLFIVMALPIMALVWHAFGQLKWESFHRHRAFAEELSNRINDRLLRVVATEQGRPIQDYSFAGSDSNASGTEANLNYLQRSPLSYYPPSNGVASAIGYFQIDAGGEFSTPVIPGANLEMTLMIPSQREREIRKQIAVTLQDILSENQLLEFYSVSETLSAANAPALMNEAELQVTKESVGATETDADAEIQAEPISIDVDKPKRNPESQLGFDLLNSPEAVASAVATTEESVSTLKLDPTFDHKSEMFERKKQSKQEKSTLAAGASASVVDSSAISLKDSLLRSIGEGVAPIELSKLDSGHFLLFRRVWNKQERLIQGLLVDQQAFLEREIGDVYRKSAISSSSNMIVAFNDDFLTKYTNSVNESSVSSSDSTEQDTLLYQRAMSSPLGSMQLIFSVRQLPPGPGANILLWASLAIATVLPCGFYFLYRLGIRQIALVAQQRNFVSSVSHELKTPLTSIIMYSEMLKSGWATETKKQRYYHYIHDESERLSRLISNVLKLSNIQNNELQLDLQPISVARLMEQVESKTSAQLHQSEFKLEFECADDLEADSNRFLVQVDEDSFTQIMINLIDNAVKFSKGAGDNKISVRCQLHDGHRVRFSVRDYGPGVPEDQLKKIFKLFYRPESELTRETVGTGIGLSIVHQLVNLMQGSVIVANMDPGAEFRIDLPLVPATDQ